MFCIQCGSAIEQHHRFCISCGVPTKRRLGPGLRPAPDGHTLEPTRSNKTARGLGMVAFAIGSVTLIFVVILAYGREHDMGPRTGSAQESVGATHPELVPGVTGYAFDDTQRVYEFKGTLGLLPAALRLEYLTDDHMSGSLTVGTGAPIPAGATRRGSELIVGAGQYMLSGPTNAEGLFVGSYTARSHPLTGAPFRFEIVR